ncbi:MAG: pyridoxamine 5'-phosphate oxidase [Saprospiraceae bacterium]|jgi:pyridoxamine 5'-phosphate oxidase
MIQNEKIAAMREDYQKDTLEMSDVTKNPIEQFAAWFKDATNSEELEPNMMTLSTASKSGVPSARIVLLKGMDKGQFVFYTNYNSQKGEEMAENPNVALTFCWLTMQRQVRIEGTVSKVSAETSTAYFQSRPKGSQIGAWTSAQSSVIEDRSVLENRKASLEEEYRDEDTLPRPEQWGGYQIEPTMIEFWQGRTSRLHDRIRYMKVGEEWKIERLAP